MMKYYRKMVLAGTVLFCSTYLAASENAEALFDAKCAVCHSKTKPADMNKVTAPAVMGVMRHVKMAYPQKEEAVKFMVDYVLEPSKSKSICMPQKIERFGLMPSQKGNVTEEELKKISEWMFDRFPPAGFRGMGERKSGMMRGRGR